MMGRWLGQESGPPSSRVQVLGADPEDCFLEIRAIVHILEGLFSRWTASRKVSLPVNWL